MKIDSTMPEEERARWQAVRTSDYGSLPGTIYEADEQSGVAKMKDNGGEIKTHELGMHGLKIIPVHPYRRKP